ncbi:MAG TPA: hypothetical protein DCM38_01535 [Gammaproteobacteria bacterium]|nr:hypothetical protein [Gammaproteobacteria bacterium]
MNTFAYPATIRPDTGAGGFIVTFVDLLEATTQADTLADALDKAVVCLEETIAGRIRDNEYVPEPSPMSQGNYLVHLAVQMALKTALYHAIRTTSMSKTELANNLNCDEKEVDCLLDPFQVSQVSRMEKALQALGHQLVIGSMTKDTTLWVSMRSNNPSFFS